MEMDFEEHLKTLIEEEKKRLGKISADDILSKAMRKQIEIEKQLGDLPIVMQLGILETIKQRIYTNHTMVQLILELEKYQKD